MLTQRIFAIHGKEGKQSTGTVKVDVSNLKEGERAGICILQDPYAMIAVEKQADSTYQILWKQDKVRDAGSNFTPDEKRKTVTPADGIIYLRAAITKNTDKTQFYYSLDNKTFTAFGGQTQMSFNLTVFVGARFGIFCHATKRGSKGYADFDWFSTEDKFEEETFFEKDFEDSYLLNITESVSHKPIVNNRFYDLQGRPVTSLKKGLYIQNGKKIIVR